MLKVKSINKNCVVRYEKLDCSVLSTGSSFDDNIIIECKSHGLLSNDVVVFDRRDCTIFFRDRIPITEVLDRDTFCVRNFPRKALVVRGAEIVKYINPITLVEEEFVLLDFINYFEGGRELPRRPIPHDFVRPRCDVNIVATYRWDAVTSSYVKRGKENPCPGDYVLYDDVYLFQILENGSLSDVQNITDATISISYPGNTLVCNCIVPFQSSEASDDRYKLLIPHNDSTADYFNNLDEYFANSYFTCDDTRYLYGQQAYFLYGTQLKENVRIYKECGNLELDFGIGENFACNLLQSEALTNGYVNNVIDSSINKTVNYERYPYTPMYYSNMLSTDKNASEFFVEQSTKIDAILKPVKKIIFNLNFRVKKVDGEIDEGGVSTPDYGTWETNDFGYWNNYTATTTTVSGVDVRCLTGVTEYTGAIDSDMLGYLGFVDDDVLYQKSSLKKSFLRISFYDSPNREVQKLLFYSTVYFDTNALRKQYCEGLSLWRKKNGSYIPPFGQLVYAYNSDAALGSRAKPLKATMFCTDRHDESSSSDGFYLHLFDGFVNGNNCVELYMKAEFNNAKFGKTIPLVRPCNSITNKPILPTVKDGTFPINYVVPGGIDMTRLLDDMYTKVMIKYDYKTGNYIWFLPTGYDDTFNGENIVFNLFEPRLYGYDVDDFPSAS